MLPEAFLRRIEKQAYIDAGKLVAALQREAAASVRVNRSKCTCPVNSYERVEWEPDGYYLPQRPSYTLDPLYHAGVYYPQESSSMFLGEMYRQLIGHYEGIRVLDLCGAPGGKSTHLASLAGEYGLLVANEVIRQRAAILAENITRWGTGNVIVTNADPSRFAMLPSFFDLLVVDAPCSGEGMFSNPSAISEWSLHNTQLCSKRQRRIVMDAWPSLRPGGILIYSTCTFNPEENEVNLLRFVTETGATPLTVTLPHGSPVVSVEYGGVTGYGFYPDRVRGEGFFMAAMRKPAEIKSSAERRGPAEIKSSAERRGPASGRQHYTGQGPKTGLFRPSAGAFKMIESYAEFIPDRVVMHEERVIALGAVPEIYNYIAARVPVIKSGTLAGVIKKSGFIPAHDLAMSVKIRREGWSRHSLTPEEALSFLRLEPLDPYSMPRGRILLEYRQVPLGFINNIGNRVNSGYPPGWRIRAAKSVRAGSPLNHPLIC